jgi:small-conductance mechanosensitive channel
MSVFDSNYQCEQLFTLVKNVKLGHWTHSIIYFDCQLGNAVITRTDCVKELGVWLGNKLFFHLHVNYIFSVASKLRGLIHFITCNFSTLDSLVVLLYISLVRSKLEYASIAWNDLTLTDSNKLESIQKKFSHLCYRQCYQLMFVVITT